MPDKLWGNEKPMAGRVQRQLVRARDSGGEGEPLLMGSCFHLISVSSDGSDRLA